jgi:hypothetical protein
MRLTLVQMPLKMFWKREPRSETAVIGKPETDLIGIAFRRLSVVARLLQDVVDRELVGGQHNVWLHRQNSTFWMVASRVSSAWVRREVSLEPVALYYASGLSSCIGVRAFNTLTSAARPDAMTPCVDGHPQP